MNAETIMQSREIQTVAQLEAAIQAAIAELGADTAAGVARRLADAGCKGHRRQCRACPVAEWIRRKLGLLPGDWVSACDEAVLVILRDSLIGSAEVPDVVQAFIEWFDDGCYPELER